MKRSIPALAIGFSSLALMAGCATVMPDHRQAKLDGLILFGLVNRDPSDDVTAKNVHSDLAKKSCERYADDFCRNPERYEFVNSLISNTYWGGLRTVGTFVPRQLKVQRFDVIVVRFRRDGAGEFLRIASRGETGDCGWRGGGPSRALTSAGVVCEDYSWEALRAALYD